CRSTSSRLGEGAAVAVEGRSSGTERRPGGRGSGISRIRRRRSSGCGTVVSRVATQGRAQSLIGPKRAQLDGGCRGRPDVRRFADSHLFVAEQDERFALAGGESR